MTIAINYDIGKSQNSGREIYGIEVAIFDWFRAFFRYGTQEKVHLLIDDVTKLNEVHHLADEVGFDKTRLIPLDRRFVNENYTKFDVIFRPDPHAQRLFWQRQHVAGTGFAFCGLAHAISGIETGEVLEQYCLAPSYASDAIVSPSRAVQSAIRNYWDLYADYIKEQFGATYRCPVNLPIIPLGINVARFEKLTTADKRADQRQKLELGEDDFAVIWVGRMSHAIKAHPIAMFQAAERAAILSGKKIHLIMFGYFVPENAEPQFISLAAAICKNAKVTFISNKDPRFPDGIWAAGDAFLSLIDNMQESFGLTPIEAMAAGLPRVISDWNGYRDSVTHGEDGFLIPTAQPPAGQGAALSGLLLDGKEMYGGFLGKTALSVVVDVNAAAAALVLLAQNPPLRAAMADKARQRVHSIYDWKNIIPAYENLWREQAAQREASAESTVRKKWPSVLPQCPDPFTMYATYPTAPMTERDKLTVIATQDVIKMLWEQEINVFGLDMMVPPDDIPRIISHIRQNADITIAAIFQEFPAIDRPALWRTLGWFTKLGIVARQAG